MNKVRLSILVSYLEEKVPESQYENLFWIDEITGKGCAIGHASQIPQFKQEGFDMRRKDMAFVPHFNGTFAWSAVSEFFGIPVSEAIDIFYSQKKQDVISKLKKILAE